MGRLRTEDKPNKATIKRRTEAWRESIQVSSIAKRLKDHGDGKLEKPLDPSQIKAYEVLLDRLVPKLNSVEQTVTNEYDNMSNDELREQVRALITLHPWLLDEFKPGPKDLNAPQQTPSEELKTGSEG